MLKIPLQINLRIKMLILFIIALLPYSTSSAASFTCVHPLTKTEKLICSDAHLSSRDEDLNIAYKSAYQRVSNKLGLKQSQRDWLSSAAVTSCIDTADVICLKTEFSKRIALLHQVSAVNESAATWTGYYVRYVQGKQDEDGASISILGLRTGRLFISGHAFWLGKNASIGQANVGEMLGESNPIRKDGVAVFDTDGCSAKLAIEANVLIVKDTTSDCGGLNVRFDGEYHRK